METQQVLSKWEYYGFTDGMFDEQKLPMALTYEKMDKYLSENKEQLNISDDILAWAFPLLRRIFVSSDRMVKYMHNPSVLIEKWNKYYNEHKNEINANDVVIELVCNFVYSMCNSLSDDEIKNKKFC